MRALGIDLGEKRIGVAVSDELGLAAHPRTTLTRQGDRRDAAAVAQLVAADAITDVVVGLPLELSGAAGPAARRARAFAAALRAALPAAVAIHEQDERFSTVAVERVLIDADLSRKRRKQVVDRQAAAYILQGWLDARAPRG